VNIVLYDTEHFETLETHLRLFDTGSNQLLVLLPEPMAERLTALGLTGSDTIHFQILPHNKAEHPAIVYRACRRHRAGLLLLATVSFRHWQFAQVCRRLRGSVRTVLGVHDVNDAFAPLRSGGLRGWARYFGKLLLRRSVCGFVVLLEEMKQYILQQYATQQPVFVIPGSIYRMPTGTDADSEKLSIVVPGSIDTHRRNYEPVRLLADAADPEKMQVSIVGAATDAAPAWLTENKAALRLVTGAFVTIATYEAELAAANIVWAPLPETFSRPGHPAEQYGVSKSSGTFFDALRHGKPLLLPAGIRVPAILASATISYIDNEHLLYLLNALQQNPVALQRLQALAREQAARITLESVRARVLPALTGST
jgi:hypothetical protein